MAVLFVVLGGRYDPSPEMDEPSHEFLRETITEHAPFMGRLARALISDPERAADLVQDSWAEVLRRPEALEQVVRSQERGGEGRTRGWLAVVMRRRLATQLRRRRTSSELPESVASSGPGPEQTSMRLERQALVHAVLYELDEPERTALVQRFQDDLSAAEIARRSGVPTSTVKSRLARGLGKLRDELNRRHPGGEAEWLSALLPLAYPGAAAGPLPAVASTPALASPVVATVAMKKLSLAAALVFISLLGVFGFRSLGFGEAARQTTADNGVDALAQAVPSLDKRTAGTTPIEVVAPIERSTSRIVATGASAQAASAADHSAFEKVPDVLAEGPTGDTQRLEGRVTLYDGAPLTGVRIEAEPSQGNDELPSGHCELDAEGRFAIQGLGVGSYDLRVNHHHAWSVPGAVVDGVEVPTQDMHLKLDAVLLRAHLPQGFDSERLKGGSLSVVRLANADNDGSYVFYAGPSSGSDGTVDELLPTGPGYAVMLSTGDDVNYAAMLAADSSSGAYDVEFVAESPMLAAADVVLSGAPLEGKTRVSVSLDLLTREGRKSSFDSSIFFRAGRSQGRTGVLLPGSYEVVARSSGVPPIWIIPRVLQPSLKLEAGDEALVEVELSLGGGLSLTFETSDGAAPRRGFTLETLDSTSGEWERPRMYHSMTETHFESSVNAEPGTHYRSFEALPPGPTRFRLRGEGYRTEEVELHIPSGSLAEWNPVVQKAP